MTDSPIDVWLAGYVNTTDFQNKLEAEIDLLETPEKRLKARLELLSYLAPKVKGVDPVTPDQRVTSIQISYEQDTPPKKSKARAASD